MDPIARRLWILLAYIVATIPFVEWPGSVVHNLEGYARSVSFFFFVVATVDTTRKLKTLLAVYTATQVWRVLEPLYMHLKSGYWGDYTSLGNWEYMDRLSGSPYDIINPNGLGFVVIMTLPLLHFLIKPDTTARRILWGCRRRDVLRPGAERVAVGIPGAGIPVSVRNLAQQAPRRMAYPRCRRRLCWHGADDRPAARPLRVDFSHTAQGGETAQGRINGVIGDFRVSLRRPFFGHGLGTSQEANANFRGDDKPSHNLYIEIAEELGYMGLALALALIWSFVRACLTAQRVVSARR